LAGCGLSEDRLPSAEAEAVAAIRKLGGKIELNDSKSDPRVVKVCLNNPNVTDQDLQWIAKLPRVQQLVLTKSNISDVGLPQLTQLVELHSLNLNATRVTDEGLRSLTGMQQLKSLSVHETRVTAAGAAHLQKSLPKLEIVR
jgi:hypothetical protein